MKNLFLLLILFVFINSAKRNKIKECKIKEVCQFKRNLLSIEVNFNVIPGKITTGELISNSNSSFFYTSDVRITGGKKMAAYQFFPEKADKYTFKFNNKLQCPQVITIKNEFKLIKQQHTLFVSEESKIKPLKFNIQFEFDNEISFENNFANGDISKIEYVVNIDKPESQLEEERYFKMDKCYLKEDKQTINCTIIIEDFYDPKTDYNTLAFFYTDRCGQRNLLDNLFIFPKPKSLSNDKEEPLVSYMDVFKAYKFKDYEKDKKLLIVAAISKEKISHLETIYKTMAHEANIFSDFSFVVANWEEDSFLMKHHELKNDGKIKLIIHQFYTDNLYLGDFDENTLHSIIEDIINKRIVWTKQAWIQKLSFWAARKELSEEEERKIYFTFSVIAFILLLVLRCILFQRKRKKQQADDLANFSYNPKKKTD